jgi:phosphoglycolate phosphatase-like HAD superfamily hydrolase
MKKSDTDEEMEEGNAFSGALAKAKESGKKEFNVDGKKYHVKEIKKKESFQLTESEMINLIEKIVLEQKKAKGMAETEKVLKDKGANQIIFTTKTYSDNSHIFEKLGYEFFEKLFTKRI